VKALKMAVVFGECGRECLSGPGNTGSFVVRSQLLTCVTAISADIGDIVILTSQSITSVPRKQPKKLKIFLK
jgi:hypothetical protein